MRLGPHNRVTLIAIAARQRTLFGSSDGLKRRSKIRYEFMAEGALGVRRASSLGVPDSERRGMVSRSFGERVIARLAPSCYLRVTDRAVANTKRCTGAPRFMAHRAIPHRRNVQLGDRCLLIDAVVTGLAADPRVAAIGEVLGMGKLQISTVQHVARR